jgi:hypothetical protein
MIKVLSPWTVVDRNAWGSTGKVWQVSRKVEITQPNGSVYPSFEYLKNGASNRFTKKSTAQAACDKANNATA